VAAVAGAAATTPAPPPPLLGHAPSLQNECGTVLRDMMAPQRLQREGRVGLRVRRLARHALLPLSPLSLLLI
jgi:hypothetical protein